MLHPIFFDFWNFRVKKCFLIDFSFLENKQNTATALYWWEKMRRVSLCFLNFSGHQNANFDNNFRKSCPNTHLTSLLIHFSSQSFHALSKIEKFKTSIGNRIHGPAVLGNANGASSRLAEEDIMRKGNSAVAKTSWQSLSTFSAHSLPDTGSLAIPDK